MSVIAVVRMIRTEVQMKTCLLFVIALSLAIGCTSTHLVDSSQAVLWIPKVQKQLLGEDVNVRTTSGEEFSGTLQLLNVDSLRVWNDDHEAPVEIALANVSYVGVSGDVAAPIAGGLFGTFLGCQVGGAIGKKSAGKDDEFLAGLDEATFGGLLGCMTGALAGGGATSGAQYEITHWRKREKRSELTGEETKAR